MRFSRLIAGVSAFALPLLVHAKSVEVPLTLSYNLIAHVLNEQLFAVKDKLRIADDGTGCQFLELAEPRVGEQEGLLKITAAATARVGNKFGDNCVLVWEWSGQVETLEKLSASADGSQIRIEVVKSTLLKADGSIDHTNNGFWQVFAQALKPSYERVALDIKQPIEDTKAVLALNAPLLDKAQTERVLNSIRVNDVSVREHAVVVSVSADAPDQQLTSPIPEETLAADELAALEQKIKAVDAFITHITKYVAKESKDIQTTQELFEILLDTRYALQEILTMDASEYDGDPVEAIFIATWERLMPVVQKLADKQAGSREAVNYLSFITAGEVLSLMRQVGPQFGIEISVDGLRRLARIIVRDKNIDPAAYSTEEDEELRKIFGFGKPLEGAPPEPSSFLDWLIQPANAEVMDNKMISKLNNTLPKRSELDEYLSMVNMLLENVAQQQIKETGLQLHYRDIFKSLVLTTAWQESCWRQYVLVGGKRVPVRSSQGAVGMMQVNASVWRGFYDINKVNWDIAYNAKAGTEILHHYFYDFAVEKGEHKQTGSLDNLARATYSAYNGGPRALTRYRKEKVPKQLRQIDEKFWARYQEIKKGDYKVVMSCF